MITRVLYYSKDMESFATGLKRIHDSCSKADVKVEFRREEYGFTVRFHRHCGNGWKQGSARSAIQGAPSTPSDITGANPDASGTPNGSRSAIQGAPSTPSDITGANPDASGTPNGITGANPDAPGTPNGGPKSESNIKVKLRELILENSKITRKQMATSLGISVRSVQRLLNETKDVHHVGRGEYGHWEVT